MSAAVAIPPSRRRGGGPFDELDTEAKQTAKEGTRHVMRWLAQVSRDPCLTAGITVRTAIALTQFYNHAEGCARPSQATLAARVGCSRNSVQPALKRLVRAGHLAEFATVRGRGQTCRYVLRVRGHG